VQKGHGKDPEQPLPFEWRDGAIRVLFAEDDDGFREALSWQLEESGFSVHGFADGDALLAALDVLPDADLVLLDWSLPSASGVDLLAQLRERGCNVPVVFLTGHSLTDREVLALERGAADFVDKARGVGVLVRRLKRLVRTASVAKDPTPQEELVCGKLVLRPAVSRALWRDKDVGLTVGEYKIVDLLASNAGREVSYRSLYDCLHYEGFIAGAGATGFRMNVRSVIRRIRSKFKNLDPAFDEIVNHSARGYWWKLPETAA
jgi:two-component system response regulator ChvI